MRPIYPVVLLAAGLVLSAQAADIRVLSPGFVSKSGLVDLAAAFTKETGTKVRPQECERGYVQRS
jgi:accessory colonization factor AcfC